LLFVDDFCQEYFRNFQPRFLKIPSAAISGRDPCGKIRAPSIVAKSSSAMRASQKKFVFAEIFSNFDPQFLEKEVKSQHQL